MQIKRAVHIIFLLIFSIKLFAGDKYIADPDPKRYQNEIDAFAQWDQKNSFPEKAILFAGSSSIRMWKTHDAFPDYRIINRGFGGAHISDILYYYNDVILKYKPSHIVFYCGDNDIAGNKPVKQVFDDYLKMISKIEKDLPGVKFIFISIKPSGSRWDYWEKMSELNRLIIEYTNQKSDLFYLDLATPLLNSSGKPDNDLFRNDQLHLNEKGYQIWDSILGKVLKSLNDNK